MREVLYKDAIGRREEVREFRSIHMIKTHLDKKQSSVVLTIDGVTVYEDTKSTGHINALWTLLGDLISLKNKRASILAPKTAKGRKGVTQIDSTMHLDLLNQEYDLLIAKAQVVLPTEWLAPFQRQSRGTCWVTRTAYWVILTLLKTLGVATLLLC